MYILYIVLILAVAEAGAEFVLMWRSETTIFYFLVAYFDSLTSVMVLSDRDQFLENGPHLAGDAAYGIAVSPIF